jgi:hypothetical protein
MTDRTDPLQPVWPPASERDAHLGAYQRPPSLADVLEGLTEAIRETLPAIGEAFTAMSETLPDPAPAGLTAAQEIRGIALRAAVELVIPIEPDVTEDEPQDGVEGPIRDALLVAGRFAAWITGAPDTAACPDPAMHDPLRGDIAAQRDAAQKRGDAYRDLLDKARDEIAELRTGRLEAEADFEASLAREQIAVERVAKLAALAECRCGPEWTERSMHGPACDQLQVRAILADQGEET